MTAPARNISSLKLPPRTALEVFEMLPEGTLAEVIDNILYMSPYPIFHHQEILGDIYTIINVHVKALGLGKCVVAPMDVYFSNENIVQPDIVFIASEKLDIVKSGKVRGTPELLIEILSSNKKHDLEKKKNLYEKFGVKEYFIVDPANKQTITYYHDGKKYIQQDSKPGKIKSKLLKKTFTF